MHDPTEPVAHATVVIPALDAAATLDAQLAALAEQDASERIECIVVDNGSTDATAAVAASWCGRLPGLRVVVASDRPSPGYARNVGIAAATSDRVLLCDADDLVDAAWARRLLDALSDHDAVAGGSVSWDGSPLPIGARPARYNAGLGFLPGFSSCSAAIRRSAWSAVGGFDEDLTVGEDIDLAWRMQLAGFTLVSCPDAFVYYRVPTTVRGALHKWYRYGRAHVRLYRKHRDSGFRAEPVWKVVAKWLLLVVTAYRVFGEAADRDRWCRDAGRRAGRVVGSLREHVVFP